MWLQVKRSPRPFRNSVYSFIFFPLASLHHALQLLIRYWLTGAIMMRIWHCQHFNTLFHYIFLRYFLLSTDWSSHFQILDFFFVVTTLGDMHNFSFLFIHVWLHWEASSTILPSHSPHTGQYLAWLTLYQARDLTISVAQFLATSSFYTRLVIIYSSVSFIVLHVLFETLVSLKGLWDYSQEL